MKLFKKIVVGIDFSDSSKQALRQAELLAREEDSRIVALHAVTASEVEDYKGYYLLETDAILKAFRNHVESLIEETLGDKGRAEARVSIGIPYRELVQTVEEENADLLVLGSRGKSAAPDKLGFFAAKCVRHGKHPVLLTRENQRNAFRCIVACVDFSDATADVIEVAAKVALDEKAALHIVHADCPPWMRATHILYDLRPAESPDFQSQYRELKEEQLLTAVNAASQFLPLDIHRHFLEHANPGQAILDFLASHDADLAIIGRRGHTALRDILIGSMAERIIHHSPCSVLTVPPGRI